MKKLNNKSIDEYISAYPADVQKILEEIRKVVREEAVGAVETISYQMPTFKLNGKNLVHFAVWKNHIAFYPTPSGTREFEKELSVYHFAKGSIRFPLSEPMPYELVRKIVAFRVKEVVG